MKINEIIVPDSWEKVSRKKAFELLDQGAVPGPDIDLYGLNNLKSKNFRKYGRIYYFFDNDSNTVYLRASVST